MAPLNWLQIFYLGYIWGSWVCIFLLQGEITTRTGYNIGGFPRNSITSAAFSCNIHPVVAHGNAIALITSSTPWCNNRPALAPLIALLLHPINQWEDIISELASRVPAGPLSLIYYTINPDKKHMLLLPVRQIQKCGAAPNSNMISNRCLRECAINMGYLGQTR